MFKRFVHFIFFGNYFYGCCTVALAIEANLQQNLSLNSIYFYLLLYFSTVLFYIYAYIQEKNNAYTNPRTRWYVENRKLIKRMQLELLLACTILSFYLIVKNYEQLLNISPLQILGLLVAGFVALAYYGISLGTGFKINTRNTGWFKPFAIGFVWASAVTYAPVIWYQVEHNIHYNFNQINLWFFIKNFMYISLLAILFDIKDYAADHNRRLQTFVVRMGLHKTIFFIIIPLTVLGFLSFLIFAFLLHFPTLRIIINSIPFVLLLIVAWSMRRDKPIIYYLAVIDGLMLIKALCGIAATLLVRS
jgi:4-hydroxybenzoate polyprenyltransferase